MRLTILLLAAGLAFCAATAVLADKAAQSVSLPTTARGNEPFWSVTLDNGLLVFQQMDGPRIDVTLPKVDKLEGGAMKFSTDLAVTLTPAVCRDTMSGMPHPLTATVETGGQTLEGCAGAPVDLLAGEWVVTSVGDAKVADAISVTIAFDPTHDRVSGGSGCNRYFGGFSLTGEGMTFGQGMGGTMMMCDDAQMKIERSFLDAMPKVTGFDIDADGNLLLKAGDDTAITAKR